MTELRHLDEGALARRLDGTDDSDERRHTEGHLADCASCREEWVGLRRVVRARARRQRVMHYARRVALYTSPALAAAAALLLWVRSSGTPATEMAARHGRQPVVTTAWLAGHLTDPTVVVLQLDQPGMPQLKGPLYATGHIPGAREVGYAHLVANTNGLKAELPPADSLRSFLETLGVSSSSHVILSGGPLLVARAYFTLCYLGITDVSVLDGGVTRWRQEGRPTVTTEPRVARGRIESPLDPAILAHEDYVLGHLGKPGVSFVDARTPAEYDGTGEWQGVPSTGHIEGARLLEWREMFENDSDFTLRSRPALEAMMRQRVTPGDTVVAYCFNGGRSSTTYLVAVLLGYPAKLYDGSYEEWSRDHLPTVRSPTPLLTS